MKLLYTIDQTYLNFYKALQIHDDNAFALKNGRHAGI